MSARPRIEIVLGLGFGDEGKGTMVDWLARRASAPPLVVRWNGGPQAQHHVVTADGRSHCFAQLGAGSLVPGARTHLGPDMAIDPYALVEEARALAACGVAAPLHTVTIDPRAIVVTPWHAIVNRIRELARGGARHGSTGRGIAEARLGGVRVSASSLVGDFATEMTRAQGALAAEASALATEASALASDVELRELAERARDRDLHDAFVGAAQAVIEGGATITATPPRSDHVILEGAHGALLDRDHGFFPHVTPARITRAAAIDALAAMGLDGPVEVWGVWRAVHTRHGEGPFPSEDPALAARLREVHNPDDGWAGRFRVGWFDAVLARYAIGFAGPIDRVAITCVDRVASLGDRAVVDTWNTPRGAITDLSAIEPSQRTATAAGARPVIQPAADIVAAISASIGRPIDVESWGATAEDKRPATRS